MKASLKRRAEVVELQCLGLKDRIEVCSANKSWPGFDVEKKRADLAAMWDAAELLKWIVKHEVAFIAFVRQVEGHGG